MKIRELSCFNEFKSMKGTWNELLGKSHDRNIFLSWEWLFKWWEHFGTNKKLKILIIEDQGDAIGIMPLFYSTCCTFFSGYNVVENIGINLSDYGGIIYSVKDEYQINKMFDLIENYLNYNKLFLRFDQVPNDSKFLNILHNQSFRNSLFIGEKKTGVSSYLLVQSSLDNHLNKLSKNFRKNLRRGEQKIEKNYGNIKFKKILTLNYLDTNLKDFWDLNKKKMIYQNLPSFTKIQMEFLTEVSKEFAENGWLSLSFLDINGRHASVVLGFEYENRFYYYQNGFDPQYSSYSIGNIHILYILEDLITRGLKELDFLRGDEAYKLRWQSLPRSNNRIVMMPKSSISKFQFKMLNWIFLYDEIKKHNLIENYKLFKYKIKQINEIGKIKPKNKI
ncbi:MAG: GNAT family N-acetyltransferase [Candidatus Methanoperedens sp.]|nr:GNAT family N-acetyltransferase [Candidatus Methanoperedens sp.]